MRAINAGFIFVFLKDRRGEVLAQNLQKVGFEMVKCDKHSRKQRIVFLIRDAYLYKVKAQLDRG